MMHINLNMIFYTHVEHSPTFFLFLNYVKYYKQQQQKIRTTSNDILTNYLYSVVIIVEVDYMLIATLSPPE